MSLNLDVHKMIDNQLLNWEQAKINYSDLKSVKVRDLVLSGGSKVKLQFNPKRIISSGAKMDAKSLNDRPCFLCEKNRPNEQKGIDYKNNFTILINPFPIFQKHLTIVSRLHVNQRIKSNFEMMLNLARDLNDFAIFYNGPKCGASAPDHFHFQAGNKGFMPIEEDFRLGSFSVMSGKYKEVTIYEWKNYHRGVISLKGNSIESIAELFDRFYKQLHIMQMDEDEPMLNILCYREGEDIVVHLFPRILHRPSCYFAKEDEQLIISPASVDMGNAFIIAREEDYNKISVENIEKILHEVCMSEQDVKSVINSVTYYNR